MPDSSKPPAENDLVNDEKGVGLSAKDKSKLFLIGAVVLVIVVLALIGIGL